MTIIEKINATKYIKKMGGYTPIFTGMERGYEAISTMDHLKIII